MNIKKIIANKDKYIGKDVYLNSSHYPQGFIIGKLIYLDEGMFGGLGFQFEYSVRHNECNDFEQFALTYYFSHEFPEDADVTIIPRGDGRFPKSAKVKFAWETYKRFLKSGIELKMV